MNQTPKSSYLNGRDFILEVIETFRQHPCLWELCHKDYHDRVKRNDALDQILKIFRKKDPGANRETVKKKLASMRSCFNKEMRKVKTSQATGSEPHIPKLWYFDHLCFLKDQDTPRASMTVSTVLEEMLLDEEEDFIQDEKKPTPPIFEDHMAVTSTPLPAKKRKTQQRAPTDEFIRLACTRLQEPPSDDSHIVAAWTRELKSMAPEQRIFAKKFINDIIFEGQMGTLHRNSLRINEPSKCVAPGAQSSDSKAS